MATLIATAGAANANSYCTLVEADSYHETHLYASTWTDASDDDKVIALIWATRVLDQVCDWGGEKASSSQALRWPRGGVYDQDNIAISVSIIPTWLKNATAEYARLLLSKDRLQEMDDALNGLKRASVGSLSVEFDSSSQITVLPISVQNMISHYVGGVAGGFQVPLVRV